MSRIKRKFRCNLFLKKARRVVYNFKKGVAASAVRMHRQGNSLFPESEFAPMEPPVLERVVADSQPSSSSCSTCSLEPLLTSIQYKTGITFEGYIVKTRKGRGCFTWTSGLSYIGEFKEDKREGYGKLKWPDGSTYEGHFHNDIREGEGMHKWEDSREVCKYERRGGGGMMMHFVLPWIQIFTDINPPPRFMKVNTTMISGTDKGFTNGHLELHS